MASCFPASLPRAVTHPPWEMRSSIDLVTARRSGGGLIAGGTGLGTGTDATCWSLDELCLPVCGLRDERELVTSNQQIRPSRTEYQPSKFAVQPPLMTSIPESPADRSDIEHLARRNTLRSKLDPSSALEKPGTSWTLDTSHIPASLQTLQTSHSAPAFSCVPNAISMP